MSTATVSNNHNRRFVAPPPLVPPNRRRKERDGDVTQPLSPKLPRLNHINSNSNKSGFVAPGPSSPKPPSSPAAPGNQLLAGYLAHEFLTKGTLFGEPWDPSRAEGMGKPSRTGASSRGGEDASKSEKSEKEKRYAEVADLLKSGGAHLPGIVNPTQLARFLKL